MNWIKTRALALICTLCILVPGLAACGSTAATPGSTSPTAPAPATTASASSTAVSTPAISPAPLPVPPAEIVSKAGAVFGGLQSYYLNLDIRQGKLQVKGLDVKQAEGSLQAPDRYDVKVKAALLMVEFQVPVIGLDGQQYMKDDFGNWNASGSDEKLDLPGFFDPQSGVGPTLAKLRDPQYLGTETVDGQATWHLQGTLAGKDISRITLQKLGSTDVTADAWIDPATYYLVRLALKESGPDPANWVYTFSRFNEPVTIQKPPVK